MAEMFATPRYRLLITTGCLEGAEECVSFGWRVYFNRHLHILRDIAVPFCASSESIRLLQSINNLYGKLDLVQGKILGRRVYACLFVNCCAV